MRLSDTFLYYLFAVIPNRTDTNRSESNGARTHAPGNSINAKFERVTRTPFYKITAKTVIKPTGFEHNTLHSCVSFE